MSSIHPGKKAAGEKATDFIEAGMTVGLGTGSTAYWAIEKIGQMVAAGLDIKAIATSRESELQAGRLGIQLVSFADIIRIDVDIDGADEVDDQRNLIKGGGGALLREKIIASSSTRMIVVVDDSKLVRQLGRFPLPVEVVPFGWELTVRKLQATDCRTLVRMKEGAFFITDNGNYIVDCHFEAIASPADLQDRLNQIPGVVENGLFIGMADTVIAGYQDGHTRVIS